MLEEERRQQEEQQQDHETLLALPATEPVAEESRKGGAGDAEKRKAHAAERYSRGGPTSARADLNRSLRSLWESRAEPWCIQSF
eukprot:g6604.t1